MYLVSQIQTVTSSHCLENTILRKHLLNVNLYSNNNFIAKLFKEEGMRRKKIMDNSYKTFKTISHKSFYL